MKIAIFTNNYLPNPYGVSMSIESFRKELEKMGHTVYIFAPEFKGYVDENKNVFRYPAIDFTFRGVRYPIAIPFSFKINKVLKNLEIDIVHAQHPNLLGWAARKWAKKKNVPLIFTWHTLYDQYAHFAPFIHNKLAAWWTISNAVHYSNKCDQIIVPTKSIKKIIQKWGVKNENIIDIQTGIDENLFQNADRNKIRKSFNIKDDEILLVVVTRFTAEKNIEFLFDSVILALKKNRNIKFLAGGDGSLNDLLKKKVKQENLENRIIFCGFVPNENKKDYYAAGDIFVFSSKSETQGMVTSEALYMGLPVVAVRATGSEDLVGNFVTGILVEEDRDKFAAAVEKLASDKQLREKYSANAKRIARENYTSSVCMKKLLKIYNQAIQNK